MSDFDVIVLGGGAPGAREAGTGVVEVEGVRHTAEQIVAATGWKSLFGVRRGFRNAVAAATADSP